MNIAKMNIAGLDGGVIIKKGGGGGVTIKNQEKSVDITENGTTEVTADSGFTGLSKVVVNTNVASSGGGGSDMPVIGDGKTYLYIKIAAEGRMDVPLYFSQTKANGVTIDWGDGSAPQTLSGTGTVNTTHKYAAIGDYVISLDPVDGCTLGLGHGSSSYCVMGSTENNGKVYCNMLQAVEIGRNVPSVGDCAFYTCYSLESAIIPDGVTSIGKQSFCYCYSLASVVIPDGVTSIGNNAFSNCQSLASVVIPYGVIQIDTYAFYYCYSLASVVIPDSVTKINGDTFASCPSLASVVIPKSVTSIGATAFRRCYGAAFFDFSSHTAVPSLNSSSFESIPSDCKIIVPDALYDTWKAATNWSSYASYIIKKSDWDASQS